MATPRNCRSTRNHKPHLWSRTTRKTVTEETAGDTFQCPGSARVKDKGGQDARTIEIRLDAWSGRNWASEAEYGPACTCGMKPEAGHSNVFGIPVERGVCYRHG